MVSHVYVRLLKFLIHKNHAKHMKRKSFKKINWLSWKKNLSPPIILDLCNKLEF